MRRLHLLHMEFLGVSNVGVLMEWLRLRQLRMVGVVALLFLVLMQWRRLRVEFGGLP